MGSDKKIAVYIHSGKWIKTVDKQWEWISADECTKTILIERTISWDSLVKRVCLKASIDQRANNIQFYRFPTTTIVELPTIGDEEEWEATLYIHKNNKEMKLFFTFTLCTPRGSPIVHCISSCTLQSSNRPCPPLQKLPVRRVVSEECENAGGSNVDQLALALVNVDVGRVLDFNGVCPDDNGNGGGTNGDDNGGGGASVGDADDDCLADEGELNVPKICYSSESCRSDGSNLKVGDSLKNKEELSITIGKILFKGNFEFTVAKSDRSKKIVKCVQEQCPWRIHATKRKTNDGFAILSYTNIHTCSLLERCGDHRKASSRVIGHRVRGQFVNVKVAPTPGAIINFFSNEENVTVSYGKAWRGKQLAQDLIRGTFEDNFSKLPSYCYVLKQRNPGTFTSISTDSTNRFKYFFMAIRASISGFQFMRDVIIIDATFMTNKYKGALLIACATDSVHHSYPLAWGVGDTEDTNCWTWFLACLSELIPDRSDLVIISDRGQPIANDIYYIFVGTTRILLLAPHAEPQKTYRSKDLVGLFQKAACACTMVEFNHYFEEIRQKSRECATWLEDKVRFEKWARVHHHVHRYEVMTSNSVEVLNSVLKQVKEYHICAMLDHILEMMGMWFCERREAASKVDIQVLTPRREGVLRERFANAPRWLASNLGFVQYRVQSSELILTVDLGRKTCECGVFQLDMIPCEHALAAAGHERRRDVGQYAYELTSPYFRNDYMALAYIDVIVPLPSKEQWTDILDDVSGMVVQPPEAKWSGGRPRLDRFLSMEERLIKKKYRCRVCKGLGHNAKNCPYPNNINNNGGID